MRIEYSVQPYIMLNKVETISSLMLLFSELLDVPFHAVLLINCMEVRNHQISGFSWPDIWPFFYCLVPVLAKMLNGTGYCNWIFYVLNKY